MTAVHEDDRLGTIERGKLADILVVDGDPYRDRDCLLRTLILVKDG